MDVQQHPDYAAGFYDAADLTPIWPDASPEYAAGWHAYWRCREIIENTEIGGEMKKNV